MAIVACASICQILGQTSGAAAPGTEAEPQTTMDPVVRLLEAARIALARTNYDYALEAYFKADALLTPESFVERMDSQMVISKTYLVKGSPEQAEQHARKALAIWQSSADRQTNQFFWAYSLLIESLTAQGKHAEAVRAVESVTQKPKAELVQFDLSVGGMLLTGWKSASTITNHEAAVGFVRLAAELCKMAMNQQGQEQAELERQRVQLAVEAQLLLGISLSDLGYDTDSIKVLKAAALEAKGAGLEEQRKRISAALLVALGGTAHSAEIVTSLPSGASTDSTSKELPAQNATGQSNLDRPDFRNPKEFWAGNLIKVEGRLAAQDPLIGLFQRPFYEPGVDYAELRKFWEEGLAKAEASLPADDPQIGLFLSRVSISYGSFILGDRDKERERAFSCTKRVIALAEKHFNSDDPAVALLLAEAGWSLSVEGQRERAMTFFQRALAASEKAFGKEHPALERCLRGQMNLFEDQHNYEEALLIGTRILAIREHTSGKITLSNADGLLSLASIYEKKGDFEHALALLHSGFEMTQEKYGTNSYEAASALEHLAKIYECQGDFQQSAACHQRSLAIEERISSFWMEQPNHGTNADLATYTLKHLATSYERQGTLEQAAACYQRLLGVQERMPSPDEMAIAATLGSLAQLRVRQESFDEALALQQRGLAIIEKVKGRESIEVAQAMDALAVTHNLRGNLEDALTFSKRSLIVTELVCGPDHEEVARRLFTVAMVHGYLGNTWQEVPLLRRAQAIFENSSLRFDIFAAAVENHLANAYFVTDHRARGAELLERSLNLVEAALRPKFGAEDFELAPRLENLASYYQRCGEYEKALPLFRRGLALIEATLGKNHEPAAFAAQKLAQCCIALRMYEEALGLLQRALDIQEKRYGKESVQTARCLSDLANLEFDRGNFKTAIALQSRSIEMREKVVGNDHLAVATALRTLGFMYYRRNDYDLALIPAQRALDIIEKLLGKSHPLVGYVEGELAAIRAAKGDNDEVLLLASHALGIHREAFGPGDSRVIPSLRLLARASQAKGDLRQCLTYWSALFGTVCQIQASRFFEEQDMEALDASSQWQTLTEAYESLCSRMHDQLGMESWKVGATHLALTKALLEEVRVAQRAAEFDQQIAVQGLKERYISTRSRLSLFSEKSSWATERRANVRELSTELREIEVELANRVGLLAQTIRERNLTLTDIARNLPSQSVLGLVHKQPLHLALRLGSIV